MTHPVIAVAAGCLINSHGEVLICQRPAGKIAAGKWEFPGGKIEAGESAYHALQRELIEELGVQIVQAQPLIRIMHAYTDRTVMLDTWRITRWTGEPQPREKQAIAWVKAAELSLWDLLAADMPIVTALRLPMDYVFTPLDADAGRLISGLKRLPPGALLRLRSPFMDDRAYEKLARDLLPHCRQHGLQLLLDRSPEMVVALGAAGWHASAGTLRRTQKRALPPSLWFAASCHDESEIALARGLGADFLVIGPVQRTATHPDGAALGWDRFRSLAGAVSRPVYAIGGLGPQHHSIAWDSGAQGIAGIRAYWSQDPLN
ncbi:MAG: Nudix family hydrolase [Pseudomonadota bacterium]|mgnify:CR=1 FL=1